MLVGKRGRLLSQLSLPQRHVYSNCFAGQVDYTCSPKKRRSTVLYFQFPGSYSDAPEKKQKELGVQNCSILESWQLCDAILVKWKLLDAIGYSLPLSIGPWFFFLFLLGSMVTQARFVFLYCILKTIYKVTKFCKVVYNI